MPPAGFEPMISAGERPQTYALDHAATGIGKEIIILAKISITLNNSYVIHFETDTA